MAVPKKRCSKSKSRRRRSHDGARPQQLQTCPQCKAFKPSHVVCPNCGHYQGRTVIEPED